MYFYYLSNQLNVTVPDLTLHFHYIYYITVKCAYVFYTWGHTEARIWLRACSEVYSFSLQNVANASLISCVMCTKDLWSLHTCKWFASNTKSISLLDPGFNGFHLLLTAPLKIFKVIWKMFFIWVLNIIFSPFSLTSPKLNI